jgi:hypothetical protein
VIRRGTFFLGAALIWALPVAAQQPCGGSERWAVKVCADTNSQINLQPIPISIHDLSQVQALGPLPANDARSKAGFHVFETKPWKSVSSVAPERAGLQSEK